MSSTEYKESIKQLIDSTEDELLFEALEKQLEWDVEHQNELELTDEEWNLIQEGLADYENGEVISLEEFMNKRK